MTAADNHRAAREAIQREFDRAQVFKPEAAPPPDGLLLTCGDTLTPEPVRWLWPGWLALGKLAILAGAPGTGKTTIALAVAATVTTGTHWPDGTRALLCDVLVWSGENDATDTLLPRLLAAGADKSRVFFIGKVRAAGEVRPVRPSHRHARPVAGRKEAARRAPDFG